MVNQEQEDLNNQASSTQDEEDSEIRTSVSLPLLSSFLLQNSSIVAITFFLVIAAFRGAPTLRGGAVILEQLADIQVSMYLDIVRRYCSTLSSYNLK